ncbi:MAG: CHAP domain-containing protein [Acidobacteria bacterium]|nr:CHAP domain-containing protein [Acidobacteriota bacterium]
MSLKSTITAFVCLAVPLLSAALASAQVLEPSSIRTASLVYGKGNLAAIVLHNASESAIHTTIEVLDGFGQVIGVISDAGELDGGETKSVAASVLPEAAAGIRSGDAAIEIACRYEAGDGQYVEMRPLDSKIQPSTVSDDTTVQSAIEQNRSAIFAPRLTANAVSSSVSTCGPLTSPGNPFPCSNGGNCVWFAWKMASDRWGIDFPARGYANTWVNSAIANFFRVLSTPAIDTIAVNTIQKDVTGAVTGHVGWVVSTSGNTVCTQEMSWGVPGMKTACRDRSYWNAGFIYPPSITVTSPNSSSTIWNVNSNQWVNWGFTGTPGTTVRIELVKPAVLQGNDSVWVLAASVPVGSRGIGSALVRVPTVPLRGGGYYIRVVSTAISRYWDASDWLFTVK